MQPDSTQNPPIKKTTLQSLVSLNPVRGCEWNVFAYVLNRDMIKEGGGLDDLHGVVFPLGSFSDRKTAENHAKEVMETTGHPRIMVARYSQAIPLVINPSEETICGVTTDSRGKILNMESEQYRQDKEEYERRNRENAALEFEAEQETNPESLEHLKRHCFLAVKAKKKHEMHTTEAEGALALYSKYKQIIREHHKNFPNHEKEWLPLLKSKLEERGEGALYDGIESFYSKHRTDLLGE